MGKYIQEEKIDKDGVIEIPNSEIKILDTYHSSSDGGKTISTDYSLTLVLEDENFWPYICRMSNEEALELRNSLDKILKKRSN